MIPDLENFWSSKFFFGGSGIITYGFFPYVVLAQTKGCSTPTCYDPRLPKKNLVAETFFWKVGDHNIWIFLVIKIWLRRKVVQEK